MRTTPSSRALRTGAVVAMLAAGAAVVPASPALAVPAGTAPYLVTTEATGTGTPNAGVDGQHAMSADGRFVAFATEADDLGPTDTNGDDDVYLWDRDAGATTLVSAGVTSVDSGNGASTRPSISADGRYIAFQSDASDLTADPDANNDADVFLWDRATGATRLVSANAGGTASAGDSSLTPVMSADGSTVAFVSDATDLTNGTDTNLSSDVFVWDRATGATTLVSATPAGVTGDSGSHQPVLDADGSHVAFLSSARDLVTGVSDPTFGNDVFLWEATSGVRLISRDEAGTGTGDFTSSGQVISDTGDRIAFVSAATDLVAETDTNATYDVFLWDDATDDLTQLSRNAAATDSGNGASLEPVMDADGSVVLFRSNASDLGPTDTNATSDFVIWDATTGTITLVSANGSGTDSGNGPVVNGSADLSRDGRTATFASTATDHTADTDANGVSDAFARTGGTTVLLSRTPGGGTGGPGGSSATRVADDGSAVLFESGDSALVAGATDANGEDDLFMVDGPGTLSLDAGAYVAAEGAGSAIVTVVRTGGRSAAVAVDLGTTGGTATAGSDYTDSSGVVAFGVGQRSASVSVPITDDVTDEVDETVGITLGSPTGGATLGRAAATLTIVDDDGPGGSGPGGGGGVPTPGGNGGTSPDGGGQPDDGGQPRSLGLACPPEAVPTSTFPDTGPPHGPAIECLAWWGLVSGYTDGTFGPTDPTTRGQYASIVARLLPQTSTPSTAGAPDAFVDDDGDVHEGAANTLAALGLLEGFADGTAGLDREVTRAQTASLLFRLAQLIGAELPPSGRSFADVEGVHQEAVERLAAAGIIVGVGANRFEPSGMASRAQIASLTARLLALLVEQGLVTPPTPEPPIRPAP